MKLVYAHNTNPKSVTANLGQVISMCKAFIYNGIDVTLVFPYTNISIDQLRKKIDDNYSIPYNLKIRYIPVIFKNDRIKKHTSHLCLKKVLLELTPDIFFSRDVNYICAAVKLNISSVFESHNSRLHIGSTLMNNYLERKLIKLSKSNQLILFVSISRNLSNYWLNKGIQKEKIITLHDGFDEFQFSKIKHSAECRSRLNLPLNTKIITYTGSLYANRSIDQILELARTLSEVTFLVVGGPVTEKNKLENMAITMGISNIIFTGPVPHKIINEYLFASDVLIGIWSDKVPTIEFCSPLKVFEYMASGKTIVIQKYPSILEVFKDGINAILVNPSNFMSLLEGVKKSLISNPNIGMNARDEAFFNYSWQNRAKVIIGHFTNKC